LCALKKKQCGQNVLSAGDMLGLGAGAGWLAIALAK